MVPPPHLAARPAAEVALDAASGQAAQRGHRLLRPLLGHVPAVQAEGRVHLGLHRRHGLDVCVGRSPPNKPCNYKLGGRLESDSPVSCS
eukprot:6183507-Pleurochrysis_carterae.AAC.1